MPEELPEPRHPSGRELTELERGLFCLYLVAVEAKRCAEVFLGPDDGSTMGQEFRSILPIVEEFGPEPEEKNPMAPQQRDADLRSICTNAAPILFHGRPGPGRLDPRLSLLLTA